MVPNPWYLSIKALHFSADLFPCPYPLTALFKSAISAANSSRSLVYCLSRAAYLASGSLPGLRPSHIYGTGWAECSHRHFSISEASVPGIPLAVIDTVNVHLAAAVSTVYQARQRCLFAPAIRVSFDIPTDTPNEELAKLYGLAGLPIVFSCGRTGN